MVYSVSWGTDSDVKGLGKYPIWSREPSHVPFLALAVHE